MKLYLPWVKKLCAEFPQLGLLLGSVCTTLALKLLVWMLPGLLHMIITRFFTLKSGGCQQVALGQWYFIFLCILVLFVTCIGRSLVVTLVTLVQKPTDIFRLLAQTLP